MAFLYLASNITDVDSNVAIVLAFTTQADHTAEIKTITLLAGAPAPPGGCRCCPNSYYKGTLPFWDPSTLSEGYWRHCYVSYVGLEGPSAF